MDDRASVVTCWVAQKWGGGFDEEKRTAAEGVFIPQAVCRSAQVDLRQRWKKVRRHTSSRQCMVRTSHCLPSWYVAINSMHCC